MQDDIERSFGRQSPPGAVLVRRGDLESALVDGETVAQRLDAYRREGLIRSIDGIGALLPSERTQRARLERYDRLPRRAAMRTFRVALARHGFAAAPFEEFISRFEGGHDEIVRPGDPALAPLSFLLDRFVRSRDGSHTVASFIEPAEGVRLETVAERLRRDLPGIDAIVTGRPVLEAELDRVVRREIVLFLLWALVGNLLLLRVGFGNLADALIIFLPVLWASVALLAGWRGRPLFNPVT